MLDDAADVEQREVRQPCVLVAIEQVGAVLPDRHVHVHARTVVTHQRLRHEGGRLAIGVRHVVDHVLHALQPVGTLHQRRKLRADLALAGTCHLVVVNFHGHAHLLQQHDHFRAHVLEGIHRRHRQIAALHARAMTAVEAIELPVGRPRGLFGIDGHHAARHVLLPGHAVKDEELGLRTEVGDVTDARRLQVGLRPTGNRARVPVIALAFGRFDDIAGQDQRRLLTERIHHGRVRIGDQQHVGGLDAAPAAHRRPVEGLTVGEAILIEMRNGYRDVLFLAPNVGETQIDELDFVVLDLLHHFLGACHVQLLLFDGRADRGCNR